MDRRQFLRTTMLSTCILAGCSLPDSTAQTAAPTLPAGATATGWPMHGGDPTHDAAIGKSPGLDGTRQWEVSLPRQPQTAPVVGGDLLTVGAGETVIAVSPSDGTEYWRESFDAEITGQPIIHQGRVYVGTDSLGFHALDARSGDRIWTHSFDRSFPTWVNTPTVVNDLVVATVNGEADVPTVIAVDRETGDRRWESRPVEEPAHPVVANGKLYTYGGVQSLPTGKVSHRFTKTALPSTTPAVSDRGVFLVEGGTRLRRLEAVGAGSTWTVEVPMQRATIPVVTEDLVFISGRAVSLDQGTVEYQIDTDVRCPPAVSAELGLLSRRRSVVAFEPATGEIRWTDDIPQVTRPKQPTLTEDGAYVAAGDRLIAYR